eukprot:CAMPEP_0119126072 /NCGR_PEP_ID=MMETSP1310-20130426/5133_1 /TAXON_ID=464262 /ORGANISM="Genus nov. species nov., Strain RCC2339" /LENGTH=114 /DNA_ID=CAMNT_0007116201 /DNA_START=430 /DNA_END=770 /DNA_ORIENTATION=+
MAGGISTGSTAFPSASPSSIRSPGTKPAAFPSSSSTAIGCAGGGGATVGGSGGPASAAAPACSCASARRTTALSRPRASAPRRWVSPRHSSSVATLPQTAPRDPRATSSPPSRA